MTMIEKLQEEIDIALANTQWKVMLVELELRIRLLVEVKSPEFVVTKDISYPAALFSETDIREMIIKEIGFSITTIRQRVDVPFQTGPLIYFASGKFWKFHILSSGDSEVILTNPNNYYDNELLNTPFYFSWHKNEVKKISTRFFNSCIN